MPDWGQFLEDADGRSSAARLNMIIGVAVGSIVVLWLTYLDNLGGEIFGTYMLCTGGVYVWGKTRESMERVEQTKADSPNQAPVVVPPLPPVTNINLSSKPDTVNDENITANGDVNVSPSSKPKRKR